MDPSKNLSQNLDEFKKMTIELANDGGNEKLSDENEAIILLNSLHESFKDVKAAIKYGRLSFTTAQHTTKEVLKYIHSDLWGSAKVPTHGGNNYFLSLIDDYLRKVWIYLLKSKYQAFHSFKAWKKLVENQTSKKIKTLRTDNGLEFCKKDFNKFCNDKGIQRHKTVRYTPQQNGVAERMNMTILDKVSPPLGQASVQSEPIEKNRATHSNLDDQVEDGDKGKRRSTSSYFFTIAGCCVSWKSQLQSIVALSTTEADYIVVTKAIKETIWLQGLLGEIKFLVPLIIQRRQEPTLPAAKASFHIKLRTKTTVSGDGFVSLVSPAIRREAQAALLEYLHSTRSLQFLDAEHMSKNSPHFIEQLLKQVQNATDIEWSIARYLRYHPINEFEPFFESLGLKPFEYRSLLPHDLMFLSDDELLLDNYYVLCNYGIARSKIGKIYKQAMEVIVCSPYLLIGGVNAKFVEEQLGGLIRQHPGLIFEGSGNQIIRSHAMFMGSLTLKKPNSILSLLNVGRKRLCEHIQENPLEMKKWVMGSKMVPLPKSGEKERSQMLKTKFLIDVGFTENSNEMGKALKVFRGKGGELQERFDCIVKAGLDRQDVCKMIRVSPQILNQKKIVIELKIDFLVNGLGYPVSHLVIFPSYLDYTVQRIKLRLSMYNWLKDQGVAEPILALSTIIACTQKVFMQRYENQHPEGPLKEQICTE
ncbi:hypothetical protein EZV62_015521 [Acer yangbiense]|uniref:Integrase catalytic domain-containing protein n=1 Tax=Acer yangbiense TaxID=1000413 RepID=A0A5C7HMU3_9ROSI|nr:hypothetical protein EZV62_015521 [Acer yangbiense]